MQQIYSSGSLPSFEGINIPSRARDAWDFDEASSFLKYGLCQIELDRQNALAERFDSDGHIEKGAIPDIWAPLRNMVANLLPHLNFVKIDVSNRDQIRCLWSVHTKDLPIDIDDLSSGEKSIIQLFFPLIEKRIYERLEKIKRGEPEAATETICVLMDEPELHLHPVLQTKILDYIRSISIRDKTQFVIATHSPVLVEQSNSDELFLSKPSEFTGNGENQLIRIAKDEDRLSLLRDVFGTTANLTALRPILIVEGKRAHEESRRGTDERIFAFLSEKFNQVTFLPSGGRSECMTLADSLTRILKEYSPKIAAYAVVDRDLDEVVSEKPNVVFLPVSMIENFLVDPEIIWEGIITVRHKTNFQSQYDVEVALDEILEEMTGSECARRVKAKIGRISFRATDPVGEIQKQAEEHIEKVRSVANKEFLEKLKEEAILEVSALKQEDKRREQFDGKKILTQLYRKHLHETGMSREIFIYELARQAKKRRRVQEFVAELFDKIGEVYHLSNDTPET